MNHEKSARSWIPARNCVGSDRLRRSERGRERKWKKKKRNRRRKRGGGNKGRLGVCIIIRTYKKHPKMPEFSISACDVVLVD